MNKDKELKKIYDEFQSMNKKDKNYIRYSYFLGLYFTSHNVPKNILDAYKSKHKNATESDFINSFNCNMFDMVDDKKERKNDKKKEQLEDKINNCINELSNIKDILKKLKYIITKIRDNDKINKNIKSLKRERLTYKINKIMTSNSQINELKSLISNIDADLEINILKEKYGYEDMYDSNLNVTYKNFKNKYTMIMEEIEEYKKEYERLDNNNYSIDVSDLYDRLEG